MGLGDMSRPAEYRYAGNKTALPSLIFPFPNTQPILHESNHSYILNNSPLCWQSVRSLLLWNALARPPPPRTRGWHRITETRSPVHLSECQVLSPEWKHKRPHLINDSGSMSLYSAGIIPSPFTFPEENVACDIGRGMLNATKWFNGFWFGWRGTFEPLIQGLVHVWEKHAGPLVLWGADDNGNKQTPWH